MNKYHFFSLIFFIIAIFLFFLGMFSGDVQTGFFVVFPFIAGSGTYAFLGMIFLLVSILLFVFGIRYEKDKTINREKTSVKGGGVVLIGPLPLVFGSNWRIALVLMIVAIILIIVTFLVMLYF
jgi:uncharacterized protein (TIGR00304 family)